MVLLILVSVVACGLPKENGQCNNYTVKWHYDMAYGGCSRFWYGGCGGNDNRFKTKGECEEICVEPQGTGNQQFLYPRWFKFCETSLINLLVYMQKDVICQKCQDLAKATILSGIMTQKSNSVLHSYMEDVWVTTTDLKPEKIAWPCVREITV